MDRLQTQKHSALQIPMIEGVSRQGVPTKTQVEQAIGIGVTDDLYRRLLDTIAGGDQRPYQEILEKFRHEDNSSDHPWKT